MVYLINLKMVFFALLMVMMEISTNGCHQGSNLAEPSGGNSVQDTTESTDTTGNGDQQSRPNYPDFVLFNIVHYRHTPSNLMPYLYPTKIANEARLLNGSPNYTPNPTAIKNFAKTCKPYVPVTLESENWPYFPAAKLENTISKFKKVVQLFKSVNTKSPIGFYGVPPKQAFKWSNIDPVNNPTGYNNWKAISHKLGAVAEKVNIFLPSFYMYTPDTVSWRKMVDATINEIKSEYSKEKPIYAYIWPQYHAKSDPYSLKFIDTSIWRYQLEVLYKITDGCIIWTSDKDYNGNPIQWDPNMPWWQTTKSFLVDKGLVPPFVMDSLYAKPIANKVRIGWATSTDTTTDYFVVQHSVDKKNFQNVSNQINPISTYFTENSYKFIDSNLSNGDNYYRLLIVDKENKKDFSDIVKVN